jgi:hypothetical protein
MTRRRKYKHNGSQQRQTFSDRLILMSFCCRRSGITTLVLVSVKPSRRAFTRPKSRPVAELREMDTRAKEF